MAAKQNPNIPNGETLVTCYYSCVAQKSYGSEKRFLCPPPIVSVQGQKLPLPCTATVTIINDNGQQGVDQKAPMDESGKTCFKYLHVTSSLKSKAFNLKLNVQSGLEPEYTVESKPIAIISKPSKKTLKSKCDNFSINSGSMVSLFNRVNSQTVRTKYMGIEKRRFCAKNSSWTAFIISAVKDGEVVKSDYPVPIYYGDDVVLSDPETGYCSEVLTVKKIMKNTLIKNATGPVTHLQKVALHPQNRSNLYLSIVPSSSFGNSNPFLCYQGAQKAPAAGEVNLDDFMCWTIVGIEKTELRLKSQKQPAENPGYNDPQLVKVNEAKIEAGRLVLTGEGLAGFEVLLGKYACQTISSHNLLMCSPPIIADADLDSMNSGTLQILLRQKGFVFSTRIVVIYEKHGNTPMYYIKRLVS